MATVKVKFRAPAVGGEEGHICYQISHERRNRTLHTPYRLWPHEWETRLRLTDSVHTKRNRDFIGAKGERGREERRRKVVSIYKRIRRDLQCLTLIIRRLEDNLMQFDVEDIAAEFSRHRRDYSLGSFMRRQIARLKESGRVRTAETYGSALRSFRTFLSDTRPEELDENEDIMLAAIDGELTAAYEAWLKRRGTARNTISFYNRILRAVYNRAVREGDMIDLQPFRSVYTGIDRTVKRALPLELIKEIKEVDLSDAPAMDYARDMFMLSFMLRGMSFVDMSFLRKSDLVGTHIVYRRRKTGRQLSIKLTGEMQAILKKYPENRSHYMLPIIKRPGLQERYVYRNTAYKINYQLKRLALRLGIPIPLTLYVARHSWASIAQAKGIPLGVVSEGMGHESERTTRIYLAGIDTSVVDQANSLILDSL